MTSLLSHSTARLVVPVAVALLGPAPLALAQDEAIEPVRAPIPADLIGEESLANELGVNEFTAPSIDLLFEQLDALGNLEYQELSRTPPETLPPDRSQIALSLGTLIADGFAAVQANRMDEIQVLGRSILEHAEALGTGERVRQHSRNLINQAANGGRAELREALSATQGDVEAEMVELRDVDLAHLISLGGWLRAFQYGCHSLDQPFDAERVRELARLDVLAYFRGELDYLAERVDDRAKVDEVRVGLRELERLLDRPRTREYTRRDLDRMTVLADALMQTIAEE